MTFKGTSRRAFVLACVFGLGLTIAPGSASAGPAISQHPPPSALVSPAPMRLAELAEDGGEGIYDGGAAARAPEAVKPKEAGDYSGPLGGLGISCEDQKDLEALAFGTYGNVLKALAGNPTVVKCPPKSGGTGEGAAPSSASGAPEGKGARK
jgi:hypothetical protein